MYKWIMAALAAALLITGCGAVGRNETSPPSANNGKLQARQSEPGKKLIQDRKGVESHLEELAKGVEGVNNAHCVIIGNTAIVGIDVEGDVERSRVGTIKYSVAEAFRNDPHGVDAFVTADIDISNRLAEIGEDVRRGRAVAGFAEEMAEIIGRLVPQLPRHLSPVQPDPDAMERLNRPSADNGNAAGVVK